MGSMCSVCQNKQSQCQEAQKIKQKNNLPQTQQMKSIPKNESQECKKQNKIINGNNNKQQLPQHLRNITEKTQQFDDQSKSNDQYHQHEKSDISLKLQSKFGETKVDTNLSKTSKDEKGIQKPKENRENIKTSQQNEKTSKDNKQILNQLQNKSNNIQVDERKINYQDVFVANQNISESKQLSHNTFQDSLTQNQKKNQKNIFSLQSLNKLLQNANKQGKIQISNSNLGNQLSTALSKLDVSNINKLQLTKSQLNASQLKQIFTKSWPKLVYIYLSNNNIGSEGCKHFQLFKSTLKTLSLNENNIGEEGAKILANIQWTVLHKLSLNHNALKSKGALEIAKGSWKKLQVLYLNNNEIGDQGVMHLSKVLEVTDWDSRQKNYLAQQKAEEWNKLDCLSLNKNLIGPRGAWYIAKGRWKLQKLYLTENSLGKEGLLNLISGELKDETKIELKNIDYDQLVHKNNNTSNLFTLKEIKQSFANQQNLPI